MVKRSQEYHVLVNDFSAKLGFNARPVIDDLVHDVEVGLMRASRTTYDIERVGGVDVAVRKIIKVMPSLLTRPNMLIGVAYWVAQNYSRVLNLGITRVPCDVRFNSSLMNGTGATFEMESGDGLGDLLLDTYYGSISKGVVNRPQCRIDLANHFPTLAPDTNDPELHKKLYLEITV